MNRATIDELLSRHRRYHNGLQVDRFIVAGAGITRFGMYRQALREMHSRWHSLRMEVLSMRRLDIEIRELNSKQLASKIETDDETRFAEFQREKRALEIEEKKMRLQEAQLAHADGVEEFCRFAMIAEELHAEFGSISDEERERLELEFHFMSLKRDAAMEIETMGRPSSNTLRLVGLLPNAERGTLIDLIMHRPEMLTGWARCLEYNTPDVAISPRFVDEVKALILAGSGVPQLAEPSSREKCRPGHAFPDCFPSEPLSLHE